MIKLMKSSKIKINTWGCLILPLVFILNSCQNDQKKSEVYFYKATDKENQVNAYFKRVILNENNKRTDSITRFNA